MNTTIIYEEDTSGIDVFHPTNLVRIYEPINTTLLTENIPDFNNPLIVFEAFFLGLMILLTISGNLLVIVAVVPSPTLRSPTHSLIVNLAVADLLLGITVLPLSATRELYAGAWLLGPNLCSIWTSLDVLCCTASILSLCGISVDRYIGVSRPLAYSRILTKRRARVLIAVIWTLALAISIAPPLGWKDEATVEDDESNECHVNKQLGYVIFSACGSFYIPALVIIVLYFLVYRAAIRHSMFLSSGSRVTRSDVTLRVHMGSTRISAASRTSLCEPVSTHHKAVALAESKSFSRYGSYLNPRPYPGCEKHKFRSDAYFRCCIQKYTSTLFHYSGTCKMGPLEDTTSVLDPQLRVKGIKNLRVIDASIMPTVVAGHTNGPVIMIGEKGADLVKETWANAK